MPFTHKIVWISDLHQTVSGQVEGVNSRARLHQVVEQVNAHHADALCCVASGDLCDTGTAEEYTVLSKALSDLRVPFLPMIGNHDNRPNMMAALPRPGTGPEGYYQYRHDLDANVTLLCLDTHLPGSDAGQMDSARLDWLASELEQTRQARDRMTTKDRGYNKVYWLFSDCGIEKDIYKVVNNKKNYTLSHFKKDLLSL